MSRSRLPELRAAYLAQHTHLVEWLGVLPADRWEQPSRLPAWTVRQLAFHSTDMTGVVVRALTGSRPGGRALSIAEYVAAWPPAADEIAAREATKAEGLDPSAVMAHAEAARRDLIAALDSASGDPVVVGRRGNLRLSDLMATRVNEAVVHSLDLSASIPDLPAVVVDRDALGVSCRMLAGILAERVPGHTVEVRVPPYAAVQCIAGPRHTRGTPPNVVEADAVTWVEVATGRRAWREAVASGQVRISGNRADLSEHLPVLG